jgi:hypothetical protein
MSRKIMGPRWRRYFIKSRDICVVDILQVWEAAVGVSRVTISSGLNGNNSRDRWCLIRGAKHCCHWWRCLNADTSVATEYWNSWAIESSFNWFKSRNHRKLKVFWLLSITESVMVAHLQPRSLVSIPFRAWIFGVCVCMCVFLCLCTSRGLTTNWSPTQGVLPNL